MASEYEISEAPEIAPGISFADMFKYGDIIGRVIMVVKSSEGLAVGASMDLDMIKFRHRGKEFEYDPGLIKRIK